MTVDHARVQDRVGGHWDTQQSFASSARHSNRALGLQHRIDHVVDGHVWRGWLLEIRAEMYPRVCIVPRHDLPQEGAEQLQFASDFSGRHGMDDQPGKLRGQSLQRGYSRWVRMLRGSLISLRARPDAYMGPRGLRRNDGSRPSRDIQGHEFVSTKPQVEYPRSHPRSRAVGPAGRVTPGRTATSRCLTISTLVRSPS